MVSQRRFFPLLLLTAKTSFEAFVLRIDNLILILNKLFEFVCGDKTMPRNGILYYMFIFNSSIMSVDSTNFNVLIN